MRVSKINLSSIIGVGHTGDKLGLLIDRGEEIEYLEVPAPRAAYEGLQDVAAIANNNLPKLASSQTSLPEKKRAIAKRCGCNIAMSPVASSMANAVGYNEAEQLLQIEFKNGSVYQYQDVEPEIWENLAQTESPGKFFNTEIKGYYSSQKL